ncbi:hypothetical protein TEA_028773 [Camellia sinensis var. sinensis]|uniref:Peptidase M50 domain-containing protein n=1 Tax=Camellia sinensis var. sinensis TaxID=542762 RepID=A0A4S4EJ33_CAMSN|nr:hypothetical protein TEA_028773 [Camellia sinensis var. sinensis]
MELLGLEKVDPADVKLIKKKLFGYSTFWVTKEEPFGDLGEGILFLGNLRGKREKVFSKLQNQLAELMGNEYDLFMVEEPNSEGPDLRGGPRVSFGMLRKEVSEPGPTTLWQYVIALLLFVLTISSSVELGIASQQINRLPPEVVKYFTYPNAIEPPDMQFSFPFVELCPGIWCPGGSAISQSTTHLELAILKFYACVIVSSSCLLYTLCIRCMRLLEATYFKSILPDRKTKVDISLAGPFAGATLSFSMFVVGLLISSNPHAAGDLVQFPSMLFQGSLLLGLISRATLGYVAMHTATVWVHPLVIAGWCGLTTSAFNMLPVVCLDGGRAIQAREISCDKRGATIKHQTSSMSRGGDTYGGVIDPMGSSMRTKETAKDTFKALWHENLEGSSLTPTYVTWTQVRVLGADPALGKNALIGFGLTTYTLLGLGVRAPEKPCLNDVTEVGTWRRTVLTVAIFLVVLTLLPVWDELTEELGIGENECSFGLLIERLIEVCFRFQPNAMLVLTDSTFIATVDSHCRLSPPFIFSFLIFCLLSPSPQNHCDPAILLTSLCCAFSVFATTTTSATVNQSDTITPNLYYYNPAHLQNPTP